VFVYWPSVTSVCVIYSTTLSLEMHFGTAANIAWWAICCGWWRAGR